MSRFGLHPPPAALSAKTALNPPIHVWRSPTDCQSSKKGVQNGLKVHIVVFETILQVLKLSFIKNLPTKLTNQLVTGEKSKAKRRLYPQNGPPPFCFFLARNLLITSGTSVPNSIAKTLIVAPTHFKSGGCTVVAEVIKK